MAAILEAPPPSGPPTDRLVTGEELLCHPEWGPCELIRGKVVPVCRPNTVHGILMTVISSQMYVFAGKRRLGQVVSGDAGVYVERGPDTVRGPDVYFVAADRLRSIGQNFLEIAPDLCVEIVSPSDRNSDIEAKVAQFLKLGVKLIWVIDPGWRHARVYHPDGVEQIIPANGTLSGEDILPGFELSLTELFSAINVQ